MASDTSDSNDAADAPRIGQPLRLASQCWMVGHRNPSSLLQCNTYLRMFGEGATQFNVCVDPGSQFDFSVVENGIRSLLGDLSEVDLMTLNHQDPDVVGNASAFCDANPRVQLMVTEDTWRLVQHLLFKPGGLQFANGFQTSKARLTSGHAWQPVSTPFCHFRGAMAFYDPELRTLFTGDLFGGLNQLGRVHLFAESADWPGIAQFHQIYMPTREVLRYAVRQIRALRPVIETIAPQHGYVITGDRVPEFLDKMHELLVGHDLLAFELDERYRREYQLVLSQMIAWIRPLIGNAELHARLSPAGGDDLTRHLKMRGNDYTLESEGYSAVAKVFHRLSANESQEFTNTLRSLVLAMCSERGLPIPPIGAGVEQFDTTPSK